MSKINVQGNEIGLLYVSGAVSEFVPKLQFDLIEYGTGYYLNITTVDKCLVEFGKVRQHVSSWSKEWSQSEVYRIALKDVLIPMMENRYGYIID